MNKKRLRAVVLLLSLIVVLLLITVFLLETVPQKSREDLSEEVVEPADKTPVETEESVPLEDDTEVEVPDVPKSDLYFVIDDVGNNLFQLKPFLELPFNITFAVLPGLMYTQQAIELIKEAGKDYIIHQPMEAVGGQDPGPGALMVGMSKEEVEKIVSENIKDFGGVHGMNNHMGSAGTADPVLMKNLFEVLKEKHIYFLDSRTTSKSVARKFAESAEVPFAERSIFLDNSKDRIEIIESLDNGLSVSKSKGHAVMIGHIWTEELANILLELYPSLLENNYALNNLTELFTGNEFDEDTWY